ncbi:hypothetical protein TrCOL_g3984 [Triparma columacea]|uniref:GOLD domain-containing protein n=1 Tax=Triparma columacea TaxID=722753 RepID=A0A9W7FWN5_9STRA|nr:hypothetical protein TrCOL_g3984 [Triparma columacea]
MTKRGERRCMYSSLLPSTDISMTFLPPSWPSGNEKKARSNKEVSATATTTTYTVEILAGDDRLLKELVKIDNKDVPTIRVESMYELFKDKVQKQRTGDFNFELCFTASSRYGNGGVIGWHMEEKAVSPPSAEKLSKMHISGLQKHLNMAQETARSIVQEFNYLKNREVRMHKTSESTNRRIIRFSCCSIMGLLGFSAVQLWWLRRWFKSKKLL